MAAESMAATLQPDTARRRVAALQLTKGRRERRERALQVALGSAREAHAQAQARYEAQLARVEAGREQLRDYHDRIAQMMSGGSAFRLADLNATMRYADVCADQLRQSEGELAARETALRGAADALAAAARALALNRSRIDLCGERIVELHRALDHHAAEAADEEAEETALARLRQSSLPAR